MTFEYPEEVVYARAEEARKLRAAVQGVKDLHWKRRGRAIGFGDMPDEPRPHHGLITIDFPEIRQRRYCATCHAHVGTHIYPPITVEVPPEADARQPAAWGLVHIATCPVHPAAATT